MTNPKTTVDDATEGTLNDGDAEAVIAERLAADAVLGDRATSALLIEDQREANQHLIGAALLAHEQAADAVTGQFRAEALAEQQRELVELRELFIGILGHDLRTPLGAIELGARLMIARGNLDDDDAKTAARLLRGAERMSRMVREILELTHARLGGGLHIAPRPTDLGDVCRDIVDELAGVQLRLDGDLFGSWDADRVTEMLVNLTGNAKQYGTPGSIVVSARGETDAVVIEVANDGDPIPDDVLPILFEPFRRGRPREKSFSGNLGLGLFIAAQIARAHGGTLAAHCAEGRTTFTARLPRQAPPSPDEVPPASTLTATEQQ